MTAGVLAAALALAAPVPAAPPVTAPPSRATGRDLRILLDPDNPALFGIGGWDRQVAQTGTIFYLCREEACGPGSTVSVRRQNPADVPSSAERLRQDAVARGQTIMRRTESGIVRIETGKPKMTQDKLFRLGEITQTFTLNGRGDVSPFWKNGYVANKTAAFTVVSSGQNRQKVDTNYTVFNIALMLVLQRLAGEAKPAE
ncbi:MAG TPA: hypothetical protein VF601_18830 [Beijerinckiaceae bacterium]